jgi:hypothetical protein
MKANAIFVAFPLSYGVFNLFDSVKKNYYGYEVVVYICIILLCLYGLHKMKIQIVRR